jgi:ribonuclease E
MTVVDVNTGKFVGSGGNLEETVTKNNLEAAEEIVRQLRLRDIGGIIVVDFIDMVLESNRDLVLRRLVECLSRDRTKHQVAEVTSLGLVQMTRKKLGLGLLETFSEPCEVCAGRGVIVHHDPVSRHRAPQPPERRRGGKGGGGSTPSSPGTNGSTTNGNGHAGTHAITDDAKNALAQIAASTLHAHQDASAPDVASDVSPVLVAGTVQDAEDSGAKHLADADQPSSGAEKQDASRSRRGSRGRGSRRGSDAVAAPEQASEPSAGAESVGRVSEPADGRQQEPAAAQPPSADAESGQSGRREPEVALSILDIPIAGHAEQKPRVDRAQAQEILGSVLDALPEPKQPGQGRARRRVTTAGLTGGVVAQHTDESDRS